jgi:protease-4
MMEFVGLGAELTFFKHTLDKLGIEVQVVRGRDNDFKSAVEPFFLDKMSDSSRVQVQRYLSSIWSDMRADIAADRKVSAERLFQVAENMEIKRAQDAVGIQLIDAVKYRDEVVAILLRKTGQKTGELKLRSFEKFARRKFKDNQAIVRVDNPNIAVLVAEGDIMVNGEGVSSEKICNALREIRADKGIKALVLRINSPGGSALASDEIWREVKLCKARMKVIVSMGDVAASGGYYIATPANYIFAENNTITGSIGVFGVIPYTGKFLQDKLGMTFDRVATNKHAVVSTNRRLTPEEAGIIQTEVDEIYTEFINRVAEGRGLSTRQVHQLARGRVWTGTDALKMGLVDELGGLHSAIKYAQKQTKIKKAKIVYYPIQKEDPFEAILELLEDQENTEMMVRNHQIPVEFLVHYQQLLKLEQVKGIQMRLPYELKID